MRYVLILCLFAVLGCGEYNATTINGNNIQFKGDKSAIGGYKIAVFEYEGCEYIRIGVGDHQTITHKGNCKHCEERRKKQGG